MNERECSDFGAGFLSKDQHVLQSPRHCRIVSRREVVSPNALKIGDPGKSDQHNSRRHQQQGWPHGRKAGEHCRCQC